ncbi:hypothetical protein ZWY2020_034746 [Hordeum vulgare]|nr:hypothetical protein ZWY2020_034746 [Hordeum vulgare]
MGACPCLILASSTTLPTSGRTALDTSSAPKRSIHAASSGVLAGSNTLAPDMASMAISHECMLPRAMSTSPTLSPPKKPFPSGTPQGSLQGLHSQ